MVQLENHTDMLFNIQGSLCYKARWKLLLLLIIVTSPPCSLVSFKEHLSCEIGLTNVSHLPLNSSDFNFNIVIRNILNI